MSVSPEAISGLLSDPNTAPYLGAAMGLLGSSGASRLPVTMGAAMGNAMSSALPYQAQAYQNAIQGIMLPLTLAKIKWALENPNASQSLQNLGSGNPSTPTTPTGKELNNLNASSQMPSLFDPNLSTDALAQPSGQAGSGAQTAAPQQAAAQSGASVSPSQTAAQLAQQDPLYQYYTEGAKLGWPNAAQLAQQRLQVLIQYNPNVQGAIAGAEAEAQNPYKLQQSVVSQLGRVTPINPGEGQIPTSGLAMALSNPMLRGLLFPQLGSSGSQAATPSGPWQNAAVPSSSAQMRGNISGAALGGRTSMSGVPLPNPSIPGSFGNSNDAFYRQQLERGLAASDVKYISGLGTTADTSAQAKNNTEEMWQAFTNGLPTGTFANFQNHLMTAFNSLGLTPESKQIDDYASMVKNSTQLGMQLSKTLSNSNTEFEFKTISAHGVPTPGMQHNSLGYLIGQMDGVYDYNIAKFNYVNAAARAGQNPRAASAAFDSRASATPMAFASLAHNDPAYFSQLIGELRGTATGRALLQRVDREAAWMQKQKIIDAQGNLVSGEP